MILRSLFAFSVLYSVPAMATEAALCRVSDPRFSTFGDVEVDMQGVGVAQGYLRLSAPLAVDGFFLIDTDGIAGNGAGEAEVAYSGSLPEELPAVRAQPFGSIRYRADVTARFNAAAAPQGTRIVVEFSRPEVPSHTFAAAIGLYADLPDGTRSTLCRGESLDHCVTAMDLLNCQSTARSR
jgi:hypothetical protein